jgi:hypothetical protein
MQRSRSSKASSIGEIGDGSPDSTTSMRIDSSSTAFLMCSTTPATVSPTITRTLSPAFAVEAITLRAGDPLRVVVATVVRVIAAASGPAASSARVTTGASRSARPSNGFRTGRSGSGTCGARRRISSRVGAGAEAGKGAFSTRRIARARRAVGPLRAGVEACPPRPSATSSSDVVPFSVTPTTPNGAFTPGKAPPAIAPPSSSTSQGVTPRSRSTSTASSAAVPLTSSSHPNDSHTSWAGTCPASSSDSTASQIAATHPLSSSVPRPQIAGPTSESWTSPPKGSCRHGASASTGTTSRWAISTTGRDALAPAQWNSRPCEPTRVRSRRSCSSGNCVASSANSRSKASVSTRAGSRSETVGMRTRACRAATTRSVMG